MTSRREFLAKLSAALAVAGCSGKLPSPSVGVSDYRGRFDTLIRGGLVYDGTGSDGRIADVGIAEGRIVAIAPRLTQRAGEVIDASGLVVAPGFIDIHSHGDGSMFDDPRSESVIRQGITTIVVGQDGSSQAPTRPIADRGAKVRRTFDIDSDYESLGEFFAGVDRLQPSMNVASMVGLGTVRRLVIGEVNRKATESEIEQMRSLVEGALSQGACGASSGLEYTPNAFASVEEEIELCRPLASRGLPYATHMRNEADTLGEAIEEAIAIAKGAGCPLQISHLKTQGPRNFHKIDGVLTRLENLKREGMDVAFDRYPYIAYSTGLTSLFPTWSRDGGTAAFLKRLSDPATAPRIKQETLAKVEMNGGWNSVMVTSVRDASDRPVEGKRLGDYAAAQSVDPYKLTTDLLARNGGSVGTAGFAMSEENLERFLKHPLSMLCTDGGAYAIDGPTRRGSPHPRGAGSFPRLLGLYVREKKSLTMEQAIYKMTGFPASRIKLANRGRLVPGYMADITVFDPATVRDRADFTAPFQYPEGIRVVMVNGQIALRDGIRSDRRSGQALRAGLANS